MGLVFSFILQTYNTEFIAQRTIRPRAYAAETYRHTRTLSLPIPGPRRGAEAAEQEAQRRAAEAEAEAQRKVAALEAEALRRAQEALQQAADAEARRAAAEELRRRQEVSSTGRATETLQAHPTAAPSVSRVPNFIFDNLFFCDLLGTHDQHISNI